MRFHPQSSSHRRQHATAAAGLLGLLPTPRSLLTPHHHPVLAAQRGQDSEAWA